MIKDIFGGVVPSIWDAVVSLLFPQGSLILLNLILIASGLGVFLLSRFLYEKNVGKELVSLEKMGLVWILLFVVGLFITVVLALILEALLVVSISYLLKVRGTSSERMPDEEEEKGGKPHNKLIPSLLIILNLLLLGLVSVGGLLLAFLKGWWVYGWTLQIGAIAGAAVVAVKMIFKIRLFERDWTFSNKANLTLKVVILAIPIVFGGVFMITLIPNAHGGVPEEPTSDEPTNLRIMTYNIRLGTGIEEDPANQWFNRKEKFVEYLDSFDLDVFGIQEAQYFQIQYIHDNLESREYEWTGRARDNGVYDGEATAIFYDSEKFDYIDGDTFWLSGIPDYPTNTWGGSCLRVVTWVRLEVTTGESKGAQFVVFNTHYDFADDWQVKASNLLMERMSEYSGGLPAFVMGDFNLRNESKAFPILENYDDPGDNKEMRDAYRVYKEDQLGYLPYDTTSPIDWDVRKDSDEKSRIDFIFISEHVAVNKCEIPKDSYDGYRTYSDHYPVYLNCTF